MATERERLRCLRKGHHGRNSSFLYRLLGEKRQELLDQANKLRTGLFKIDETREKVEVMSLELEDAKKKVAEFQKQCEEYLVIIVQQKREADEQQKVRGPAPCATLPGSPGRGFLAPSVTPLLTSSLVSCPSFVFFSSLGGHCQQREDCY